MRNSGILFLGLCFLFFVVAATAQTVTTTGGTTNTVPKFTGTTTIGNSAITESGGFVGIGTTSPNGDLHILGNSSTRFILQDSTLGGGQNWQIQPSAFVNDEFGVVRYESTGAIASKSFIISASGNFGMGTSSPAYKLDVAGNIRISGTGNGLIFPNGTVQTTAAVNTGGTITGVAAGSGLTGGGTSGNVSLAVDSTVARTNINQTFNGNLTVNGTVTATHVNSADFTTALHGNCITESFATAYVLNGLGQNNTSNCTFGPGSPINPVLGTVIPYSGVLSTLQVVQTSLSSSDNFGGTIQVYLEPFNQVGGWTVTSLTCALTSSSGNSLNSTTTCTDGTHTTSVTGGQKLLVLVTPPQNGFGSFAPVAAELNLTF